MVDVGGERGTQCHFENEQNYACVVNRATKNIMLPMAFARCKHGSERYIHEV